MSNKLLSLFKKFLSLKFLNCFKYVNFIKVPISTKIKCNNRTIQKFVITTFTKRVLMRERCWFQRDSVRLYRNA